LVQKKRESLIKEIDDFYRQVKLALEKNEMELRSSIESEMDRI